MVLSDAKARITVVSARAPFVETSRGAARAPGGLVSALLPVVRRTHGLWFAAGADSNAEPKSALGVEVCSIALPREARNRWYGGLANGALWPLAHGFLERCRLDSRDWDAYREVNRIVAQAVAHHTAPGSSVWVHDYQLGLVPALLRERRPDLRIGFFWHIPWPPAELLRIAPWAGELVRGILGADLVGLHLPRYVRAFRDALAELGLEHAVVSRAGVAGVGPSNGGWAAIAKGADGRAIEAAEPRSAARRPALGSPSASVPTSSFADELVVDLGPRSSRVIPAPIGADVAQWSALGDSDGVREDAAALRRALGGGRVLVAVDRLDYSKGVVERLEAFERALAASPELGMSATLIQIGVPSRESVVEYRRLRERVEAAVGRIQGRFGTIAHTPVRLIARGLSARELASYYVAADVALVTPLRDGMNLVAFEYVAARPAATGRLLLSTTAGAADILRDAHFVNPYDADAMTRAITRAALLPETSLDAARMASLQSTVRAHPVEAWTDQFLAELESGAAVPPAPRLRGDRAQGG